MIRWLSTTLWILLAAGCGGTERLERFEYVEMAMASPARLVLYAESESMARQAARASYDRLHELERTLSDWDENSELSRLLSTAPEATAVSPTLEASIELALDHAGASGGAFNPTIGPLVELWRRTRATGVLPSETELEDARALIDLEAVRLEAGTARIARRGVRLDFGGIGKGIAVDEIRRILRLEGIEHHLVDFDGEIGVGAPPPEEDTWRVSIPRSEANPGSSLELAVIDCSISTSGDLHQFVEIDGTRYSHVLDPATGLGLMTPIQVTVVSPSGATSDALATAGCVLGAAGLAELIETSYPEASAVVTTMRGATPTVTRIGRIPVHVRDVP